MVIIINIIIIFNKKQLLQWRCHKQSTLQCQQVTVSDRPSAEVSHWERVQKRPVFSDEMSTVTKWLIVTSIGENDTIVWKAVLWRHDVAYVSTNYDKPTNNDNAISHLGLSL